MPQRHADECRSHYQRNKQYYFDRNKARQAALTELIRAAKNKPCADCDTQFHFASMDFDHVRGKKCANVGMLVTRGWSDKRVLDEIAKCEVVCSNCHRVRTYNRQLTDRLTRQDSKL